MPTVTCPNCGSEYNAQPEQLGLRFKCPACKQTFTAQTQPDHQIPQPVRYAPPHPPPGQYPVQPAAQGGQAFAPGPGDEYPPPQNVPSVAPNPSQPNQGMGDQGMAMAPQPGNEFGDGFGGLVVKLTAKSLAKHKSLIVLGHIISALISIYSLINFIVSIVIVSDRFDFVYYLSLKIDFVILLIGLTFVFFIQIFISCFKQLITINFNSSIANQYRNH